MSTPVYLPLAYEGSHFEEEIRMCYACKESQTEEKAYSI